MTNLDVSALLGCRLRQLGRAIRGRRTSSASSCWLQGLATHDARHNLRRLMDSPFGPEGNRRRSVSWIADYAGPLPLALRIVHAIQ
jgi:hypothetical protein